jgi:2-dehydropantoate 2-reductase
MHFVLVGPGALGCLLASMLSGVGRNEDHRFTLLDHNASRAGMLTSQGILYERNGQQQRNIVPVSPSPTEIGQADIILLCVKSHDIKDCLRFCNPLFGPDSLLIFMQNGVAHLDVQSLTGPATPAYGTTTEGATLLGPGRVLHAGRGLTQLGFLSPVAEHTMQRLEQVSALFNTAGLKARITGNILSRLWTKLMVNTGINGLTATLGCTNGDLLTIPGAAERMERLVEEAQRVAAAGNIDVPKDSLEITRDVCCKTADNISSMLQDVRSGRRTEIDAINGAIVAAGEKLGVDTPENRKLVRQVKDLELTYLKPHPLPV